MYILKITRSLFPFFALSILHVSGLIWSIDLLHQITKPLLMAGLTFYYIKSVDETPINKLVTMSLGLSLLGDTALMFADTNSNLFIAGLGFFLLAHLIYAWINFNLVNDEERKFRIAWKDVPIIVAGFAVFLLVKDGVGDLRIPVLSYIVVISMMAITARQRMKRADQTSFRLIMSGAIIFMLSDTLLALNKFVNPVPAGDVLIMITYLLAQFLIVRGIIVFIQKIRPEAGS